MKKARKLVKYTRLIMAVVVAAAVSTTFSAKANACSTGYTPGYNSGSGYGWQRQINVCNHVVQSYFDSYTPYQPSEVKAGQITPLGNQYDYSLNSGNYGQLVSATQIFTQTPQGAPSCFTTYSTGDEGGQCQTNSSGCGNYAGSWGDCN